MLFKSDTVHLNVDNSKMRNYITQNSLQMLGLIRFDDVVKSTNTSEYQPNRISYSFVVSYFVKSYQDYNNTEFTIRIRFRQSSCNSCSKPIRLAFNKISNEFTLNSESQNRPEANHTINLQDKEPIVNYLFNPRVVTIMNG